MPIIRTILFFFFALFTIAFAHAEFDSVDPADGTVLDASPDAVTLTFTEVVDTKFSVFKVYKITDPALIAELTTDQGDHAASEDDHHEDEADDDHHSDDVEGALTTFIENSMSAKEDGEARVDTGLVSNERELSNIVLSLQSDLPAGHYLIMWRALSDDTHITSGHSNFEVEAD